MPELPIGFEQSRKIPRIALLELLLAFPELLGIDVGTLSAVPLEQAAKLTTSVPLAVKAAAR
ncbi:hypothetical protein V3G39_13860 [Dermatophilaceae bacterium Sec6.4]